MNLTKQVVEEVLKQNLDSMEELGTEVNKTVFDSWISGYVAGHSLCNEDFNIKQADDLIKHLVTSEQAKRCGVTGTKAEIYKIYEINEEQHGE